jgi:myosin heavy subunit
VPLSCYRPPRPRHDGTTATRQSAPSSSQLTSPSLRYKRLPLYTPEIIDTYATCSPSSFDELPPHVFKIAAAAYNRLMDTRQPQAMLIPGESGAGKTETTKLALGLLTHAASLRGATTDVAGKLMGANPLLEALGNAKTVRNNNSSRFGKFVSINYSAKGSIESSTVHSYLLEKSRVIAPNPGERNYHIFYQMCAGAAGVYPELRLKEEPSMYYYLRMGGSVEVEGMDDAAEFKDVLKSLKVRVAVAAAAAAATTGVQA